MFLLLHCTHHQPYFWDTYIHAREYWGGREGNLFGGAGEERGWKRSLLEGFISSWLHQEYSGLSSLVVQVRLQSLLLDRGADVLAVNKTSRCGMWLRTYLIIYMREGLLFHRFCLQQPFRLSHWIHNSHYLLHLQKVPYWHQGTTFNYSTPFWVLSQKTWNSLQHLSTTFSALFSHASWRKWFNFCKGLQSQWQIKGWWLSCWRVVKGNSNYMKARQLCDYLCTIFWQTSLLKRQ